MAPGHPARIAILGTGMGGAEIVRRSCSRRDVEIVAGVTFTPAKHGLDLGRATIGAPIGITLTRDLDGVLARPDVDAVLHAGVGRAHVVAEVLGRCAEAGKDALTISGLVHPVTALGEEGAAELDAQARAGGARIVGTGINPGFLLDVLPVVWAGVIPGITRVRAQRVADVRGWGAGVLEHEIGVGRSPDDRFAPEALSLTESVALIAEALGLTLGRIDDVHEFLLAPDLRVHGDRRVQPGQVMGFRRLGRGYGPGGESVEIEWRGIFCLDPDIDGLEETASIAIDGDTSLETVASGSFLSNPYPSTATRALDFVKRLEVLPAGLYRPDQVPPSPGGGGAT